MSGFKVKEVAEYVDQLTELIGVENFIVLGNAALVLMGYMDECSYIHIWCDDKVLKELKKKDAIYDPYDPKMPNFNTDVCYLDCEVEIESRIGWRESTDPPTYIVLDPAKIKVQSLSSMLMDKSFIRAQDHNVIAAIIDHEFQKIFSYSDKDD